MSSFNAFRNGSLLINSESEASAHQLEGFLPVSASRRQSVQRTPQEFSLSIKTCAFAFKLSIKRLSEELLARFLLPGVDNILLIVVMKKPLQLLSVLSYLVAPDILFAFLIATRPSFILRLLGSLILVYIACYVATTYTTGNVGGDWGLGGALGAQPFNVVLLLWLKDPMKDFRYTSDSGADPTLGERPLGSRLYRALCILRNPRFIGLNVQLPHIPRPFQGTRFQFIRSRILRILQCLLLIDLGQSFIHTHPEFFLQGTSAFPSGLHGYILHFTCQVSWALCAYAALKLLYTITSLTCVSIGSPLLAGSPELWPDMFGSWSDGYTVRRIWGQVWHQNLSRYCSTIGKSVALSVHARPGSLLSAQIQIWVAFTISGVIHCFGDLMLGPQYVGRSVPFFLMNAAAITFEHIVLAAARKMGLMHQTRMSRIVGYVWVLVWFNYSMPTFYTWILELGLGKDEMLPFSIVRLFVSTCLTLK